MSFPSYDLLYDLERLVNDAFRASPLNPSNENSLLRRPLGDGSVQPFRPRMDLHENSEANTVTATFELPGIKKEDVQIDAQHGRLRVSAESKSSEEREKDGYAVRERRLGKYSRTLQLPEGVKEEEIKAAMENGILTVTFPKAAPESAPKKINVA
ncbi:small heat shock protein [Mycena crocata]|nr:small heat shock protein [Mycena crocata]